MSTSVENTFQDTAGYDTDERAPATDTPAADDSALRESEASIEDESLSFEDAEDNVADEPSEEQDTSDEVTPEEEESVVVLDDGTETTLSELKKGYFRHKDYIAKTTEVAEDRKFLSKEREDFSLNVKGLEVAYDTLTKYLSELIPPEPPIDLARSDPGQYQYQTATRNKAIEELQVLMSRADKSRELVDTVSREEQERYIESQTAELQNRLPHLKGPGKFDSFRKAIGEVAMKEFGFTEEEVSQTYDSRILHALHYANIGLRAEKNRRDAKHRVGENIRKSDTKAAVRTNGSSKAAMLKLHKTGSIEDAMSVDFD